MSMDKPYRIEVTVDAPRDVVWRALTEPEQIRHWFGWEYDGLDAEIEYIFVERARQHPPDRIEFDSDVTLHDLGDGRTLIRAIKPGDLDAAEWDGVYGDIEEGWITFFNQLRHRLRFHPDGRRRMIVRKADAFPELVGEPWHESRFQRGVLVGDELAIVFGKPGGEQMLLVTTYDLSDDEFAAAEARWAAFS
ncbi:SRPBCC family protein [Solirubrobacter soli]|uniref:SRPBCC family protein n=1 Tax=Solirubrobacter soli TaxID=363832 RepID=UPI000425B772|nr:SRPBCC domain-containing protein [Solirubrobacter soli]